MLLNIVYLDDEPGLCQMFEDNFATDQISIRTFVQAEEALAFIKANPPDLVFLDFRLPGTTGEQVATRIEASIPIALITGDLEIAPLPRFERTFGKPFNFDEMEA